LATRCKKVNSIIKNPKNVTVDELCRVLVSFGYEERSGKGSHKVFTRKNSDPMTVPYQKPVNKVYVKKVIELLALEEWYDENCS